MKQFNNFSNIKKSPKKETIDFILSYSKSKMTLVGSKGRKYVICKN